MILKSDIGIQNYFSSVIIRSKIILKSKVAQISFSSVIYHIFYLIKNKKLLKIAEGSQKYNKYTLARGNRAYDQIIEFKSNA